jgi:hypothetical protein
MGWVTTNSGNYLITMESRCLQFKRACGIKLWKNCFDIGGYFFGITFAQTDRQTDRHSNLISKVFLSLIYQKSASINYSSGRSAECIGLSN